MVVKYSGLEDLNDDLQPDDLGPIPLTISNEGLAERQIQNDQNNAQNCLTKNQQTAPPTTRVYSRDGQYHVYTDFAMDLANSYSSASASLQVWLRGLAETDVVYFHVSGIQISGDRDGNKLIYCHGFLNTLLVCRAKTIYVLDTHVRQACAYMAIACKQLELTPLGAMSFDKQAGQYSENNPQQKILVDFLNRLNQIAIEHKILTEDDVAKTAKNESVTLSYETLRTRLGTTTA